ncbi:hypothetical protein TNCV_2996371 [Trichonephila clavipes]|nr:hypothetical protein TNCV_2996371 [Trichonephila clavipes]
MSRLKHSPIGVVWKLGGPQLRCRRRRHLTMVQNYEPGGYGPEPRGWSVTVSHSDATEDPSCKEGIY